MNNRQVLFRPGERVLLRLETAPWFAPAEFVGEVHPSGDPRSVMYRVRRLPGGELVQDVPAFVHRDGPEVRTWQAALEHLAAAEKPFYAQRRRAHLSEPAVGPDGYALESSVGAAGRGLPGYPAWLIALTAVTTAYRFALAVHPDPEGAGV